MKWKEWTIEELLRCLWQDGLDLLDETGNIVSMTYERAYPGITIIGSPNWFPEEPLVDWDGTVYRAFQRTNCNWRSDPALDREVDEQQSSVVGSVLVHHPDRSTAVWYIVRFAYKGEEDTMTVP